MLALVDDWGNPSPGKGGTDWFGFAALLLQDCQVDEIRRCYQTVCQCLGQQTISPLHFRNLNPNSKYYITQLIASENPQVSIVAVRIHEVTSEHLRQRGWAYRYYGKEMVRVATHFAVEYAEQAQVVFHRHEYLQGIENYIWNTLKNNTWYMNRHSSRRIQYDRILGLLSVGDEDELLLGLADCVAHACHTALNLNPRWQQVNPSCLNILADCVWHGPSYDKNARLFGVILEPGGIPTHLIPSLPYAIRRHWE